MAEIRLSELTHGEVRTLSGHERGVQARELFGLDRLDDEAEAVTVVVPETLDSLSTSFLQGLFSASIKRFQGRDGFLSHYRFAARPSILMQVDDAIRNAMIPRQRLFS